MTQHRLKDLDTIARTATCEACGPGTAVARRTGRANAHRDSWRCANKKRYDSRRYQSTTHMRGTQHVLRLGSVARLRLLRLCGWGCLICDQPLTPFTMRLDHKHGTRIVRGALCNNCNTGLGMFGDEPARLRAAADYLDAAARGSVLEDGSGAPAPMVPGSREFELDPSGRPVMTKNLDL